MKEKLPNNQTAAEDNNPAGRTHETATEPTFKATPPTWSWVRNQLVAASQDPDFPSKYGLTDHTDSVLVFHGTSRAKAPTIALEGMRAFHEVPYQEPRIFVTASPTMALYHAAERGPHDTLRAQGEIDGTHNPADAQLLAIRVPKKWLATESQSSLPVNTPQWLKEAKGLLPEEDNRLSAFNTGLRREVLTLQQGHEVGDSGVSFPIDHIPPEFIEVIEPSDIKSLF